MKQENYISVIAIALLSALIMCACYSAHAFTLMEKSDSAVQTEIHSENGLQCNKDKNCVAEGNVTVTRGHTMLRCHRLVARFKKDAAGEIELDTLHAQGNVQIDSRDASYHATAQEAFYNASTDEVRLRGQPHVTHPQIRIVGSTELVYDQNKQKAFSVGRATAIKNDSLLQADHIDVFFHDGTLPSKDDSALSVDRVEVRNQVVIATPDEMIHGDQGTYTEKTQIAQMRGNVTISRCDGRLQGDHAIINMATGVSELHQPAHGDSPNDNRLELLIVPKKSPSTETGSK